MRISGGEAKGTKLTVPPGVRPASERVRQAVFASLGASVGDKRILDLYCGSGAYGLEALSRGASHATFVDSDDRAIRACRANVEAAGFRDEATIVRSAVERYLKRIDASGPFELVFADPPYNRPDRAGELLGALERGVSFGARVVVEARWTRAEAVHPPTFAVEADRRYGDTRVLTFIHLGD